MCRTMVRKFLSVCAGENQAGSAASLTSKFPLYIEYTHLCVVDIVAVQSGGVSIICNSAHYHERTEGGNLKNS